VLENAANEDMAGRGVRRVYKSRYDSISTYIYGCGDSDNGGDKRFLDHLRKYNDIPCEVDEELLVRPPTCGALAATGAQMKPIMGASCFALL
jgi:hypothetical protein